MPVLRGAVTFSRFRAEFPDKPPANLKALLARGLKAHAFEPIDRKGEEDRAAGFVELESPEAVGFEGTSFLSGEYALFSFRVDQLRVPGAVLKQELEKWASAFEKEKGRAPARSEKNATRDSLRQMLRNRAVPSIKTFDVSWNLKTHQVQIWAASRKAVDEIQLSTEEAFGVKLLPLAPAAIAAASGIQDGQLMPTAELIGAEMSGGAGHVTA